MQSSLEFPLQETMLQFHRRKLIGTHLLFAGGTSLGTRITAGNSRRSSTLWSSRHLCQYSPLPSSPIFCYCFIVKLEYIYIHLWKYSCQERFSMVPHSNIPIVWNIICSWKKSVIPDGYKLRLMDTTNEGSKTAICQDTNFLQSMQKQKQQALSIFVILGSSSTHESDDLSTSTPVGKQSYRQRRYQNWMSTSSLLHHPWMCCLTQISFFYVPSCLHSMIHRLNREYTSQCSNLREKSQCSWRMGYFQ